MTTIITRQTSGAGATTVKGTPLTNGEMDANLMNLNVAKVEVSSKDASDGIPGLTLFKLNLRNAANTVTNWFTTATTAARTWTMPDKDGTVAMTSDITGNNSGTNTGDQTNISGNSATYSKKTVSVISGNTTAVSGTTYVLTASLTLTLPASPAAGDYIAYSDRSGTITCVIARNSQNIMGSATDMTLDIANSSVEVVFTDATRGWVII